MPQIKLLLPRFKAICVWLVITENNQIQSQFILLKYLNEQKLQTTTKN